MRVGLIQLSSFPEPSRNFSFLAEMFERAAEQRIDLLALPENVMVMAPEGPAVFSDGAAAFLDQLSEACVRYGFWMLTGTLPWPTRPDGTPVTNGRVRAASFLLDAEGRKVGRYDKMHMFDVDVEDGVGRYRESDRMEAGDDVVVLSTPWANIGMSVCYDLRFSQLYDQLRRLGSSLLYIPAAFTRITGQAHWEVLLRARAIEQQCFVLAPAQCGTHYPGRQTWGHSMIIDPWGEVIAEAGDQPTLLCADLDLSRIEQRRRAMPMAQQRRL